MFLSEPIFTWGDYGSPSCSKSWRWDCFITSSRWADLRLGWLSQLEYHDGPQFWIHHCQEENVSLRYDVRMKLLATILLLWGERALLRMEPTQKKGYLRNESWHKWMCTHVHICIMREKKCWFMLLDPGVLGADTVLGLVCVNKFPLLSQWTPLLAVDLTWVSALLHACMLSRFSRVQLCDPMDCSLPGSSVHGVHEARMLEWVVMTSSRGSSPLRDWTCVCYFACGFFTAEALGNPD